jgi:undecaprenyl-diphosphatase
MAIPVIILAGGLESLKLLSTPQATLWHAILPGILFSAVSALICIHLFLKFLESIGMTPFVIYRLLLGLVLVAVFI